MLADVPTTLILLIAVLFGMLLSYRLTVFGIAILSPVIALATWGLTHGVATALVAAVVFQVGYFVPTLAGLSTRRFGTTHSPKNRRA